MSYHLGLFVLPWGWGWHPNVAGHVIVTGGLAGSMYLSLDATLKAMHGDDSEIDRSASLLSYVAVTGRIIAVWRVHVLHTASKK